MIQDPAKAQRNAEIIARYLAGESLRVIALSLGFRTAKVGNIISYARKRGQDVPYLTPGEKADRTRRGGIEARRIQNARNVAMTPLASGGRGNGSGDTG